MEIVKEAQLSISIEAPVCRVLDACECTGNCPEF